MVIFLSVIPLQLPPFDGVGFNVDKLASFAYFVLTTCVGGVVDRLEKGYLFTVFLTVFSFGMIWN